MSTRTAAHRRTRCRRHARRSSQNLGADDPKTDQQRRADLFANLLLGRIAYHQDDAEDEQEDDATDSDATTEKSQEAAADPDAPDETPAAFEWLEVEDIDPDTGELLSTQLQPINADGEPIGQPINPALIQMIDSC